MQEVRLARQVSHPSVCRVHDLGEVDGIGRLGHDKAVELAEAAPSSTSWASPMAWALRSGVAVAK